MKWRRRNRDFDDEEHQAAVGVLLDAAADARLSSHLMNLAAGALSAWCTASGGRDSRSHTQKVVYSADVSSGSGSKEGAVRWRGKNTTVASPPPVVDPGCQVCGCGGTGCSICGESHTLVMQQWLQSAAAAVSAYNSSGTDCEFPLCDRHAASAPRGMRNGGTTVVISPHHVSPELYVLRWRNAAQAHARTNAELGRIENGETVSRHYEELVESRYGSLAWLSLSVHLYPSPRLYLCLLLPP